MIIFTELFQSVVFKVMHWSESSKLLILSNFTMLSDLCWTSNLPAVIHYIIHIKGYISSHCKSDFLAIKNLIFPISWTLEAVDFYILKSRIALGDSKTNLLMPFLPNLCSHVMFQNVHKGKNFVMFEYISIQINYFKLILKN